MLAREGTGRRASSVFTEAEAEFLAENFIGRIATVSQSRQPHVVPVAFKFDGTSVYFGGWNLRGSLKFRNLAANNKVAFVVDDIISTKPWKAKGIEIRGDASPQVSDNGTIVKITPRVIRSWGLED